MLAERDLSDCRDILAISAFKETSWDWLIWDHAPRLSCTCQTGQKEREQRGKQCINLKGVEDFFKLTWVSSRYVEARHVYCLGWTQFSPLKTPAEFLCVVLHV